MNCPSGLPGRGQTYFGPSATVDTAALVTWAGIEKWFPDQGPSSTGPRSGRKTLCRFCRNESGVTMQGGYLVVLNGSNYGNSFTAYGRTTAEGPAFPLDEYLPSTGVRDDDYAWIVLRGPAMCKTGNANVAANVIPLNSPVVVATAHTTGATGHTIGGRVGVQDLTGATALLGDQIQNAIGRALTAIATSNVTDTNILVDVTYRW